MTTSTSNGQVAESVGIAGSTPEDLRLALRAATLYYLIAWPWATMTIGLLIYVASIPVAIFAHHPRTVARRVS